MSDRKATPRRPYKMVARAIATAQTREKILGTAEAAFDELPFDEITLASVAQRAGVSVQTVIRHFQNKDGLLMATLQHAAARMVGERDVDPGMEIEEVIDILVAHYERYGDRVLKMLSQEDRVPALEVLANLGRAYHLDWCEQAFRPALAGLRGARRRRRIAQLVAVTDIYVWKILRRDRGLGVAETKLAILELLEPLTSRS